MIQLDDLKEYLNNPRKMSDSALEKLKESISRDPEYMVARPIIIDQDNRILGGNQRYKACKALGYKEVPEEWVRRVEWDEEKAKRFNIVDNAPPSMAGEWDLDILKIEWDADVLADFGFEVDSEPVEDFLDESEPPLDFPEQDEDIPTQHECPKCGYKWSGGE